MYQVSRIRSKYSRKQIDFLTIISPFCVTVLSCFFYYDDPLLFFFPFTPNCWNEWVFSYERWVGWKERKKKNSVINYRQKMEIHISSTVQYVHMPHFASLAILPLLDSFISFNKNKFRADFFPFLFLHLFVEFKKKFYN